MYRRLIRLALLTLSGVTLTCVALKAICVTETLEKQFASSSVVFVGLATAQEVETATEIVHPPATTASWKRTITTFKVEEVWKGPSDRTVRVRTCGENEGDCSVSFAFQVGSKYLVFAGGEPLQTSRCVPTSLVDRASRTLEWLADKPRKTLR
jgi:hypothetical protein